MISSSKAGLRGLLFLAEQRPASRDYSREKIPSFIISALIGEKRMTGNGGLPRRLSAIGRTSKRTLTFLI